jgi:integrase
MINIETLQIIKRQKKTRKDVYIPLAFSAWTLINDGGAHETGEKIFNTPEETSAYKQMKAWAAAAGAQKNLTWHIARKTFATHESGERRGNIYGC